MTIEHRDITDPEVHEPKGVSTASPGRAYVADGAGSGSWEFPQIFGQAAAAEGAIPIKGGSEVAWVVNHAGSPSFAEIDRPNAILALDVGTPVILDAFAFEDAVLSKFDLVDSRELTVIDPGFYQAILRVIFKPTSSLSSSNEIIKVSLRKDGDVQIPFRDIEVSIQRNSAAGDPYTVENSRIIDIQANSVFDVQVEALSNGRSYGIQAHLQFIKIANL